MWACLLSISERRGKNIKENTPYLRVYIALVLRFERTDCSGKFCLLRRRLHRLHSCMLWFVPVVRMNACIVIRLQSIAVWDITWSKCVGSWSYRISQFRLLLCIRQLPNSILSLATACVSQVSSGLFMCKRKKCWNRTSKLSMSATWKTMAGIHCSVVLLGHAITRGFWPLSGQSRRQLTAVNVFV